MPSCVRSTLLPWELRRAGRLADHLAGVSHGVEAAALPRSEDHLGAAEEDDDLAGGFVVDVRVGHAPPLPEHTIPHRPDASYPRSTSVGAKNTLVQWPQSRLDTGLSLARADPGA